MADPAVLPLVLCILETNEGNHSKDDPEAQTMDEVSSLPTRSSDPDAWQLSKSGFCHSQRCFDFENSPGAEVMPPLNWMTLVCDVELTFSPVVLNILGSEDVKFLSTSCAEEERLSAMSKPMSVIGTHLKLSGAMFGDFKGELSRAERQSRPADENMVAVVKRGASKPEIGAAAVETALMDSNANRTPSRNESRRPQSFGSPVRSLPSLAVSRASTSPMNTVSLLQKSAYSPVSRPRTGSSQQSTRSKARSFSKRK